ncbi:hypothetical protein [Candidatus Igneacidithiobacillus taiwanensis]|uniref:hypothetical protein n=1 Tax=Candidatus Igneacidithiobacillus taiwanensis TaxID=1945924 RepID=UPI00289ED17B|nr:hypothetical protein [Candidatus Igneacidithiobacillus taiwanensis]
MAKVTISEAARLANVSRMTLYRRYIRTGVLSIEKDHSGNPKVDVSELVRVFGELSGSHTDQSDTDKKDTVGSSSSVSIGQDDTTCKALLQERTEELRIAREEIAWLRARIESAEQKLLAGPETKRRWWWPW